VTLVDSLASLRVPVLMLDAFSPVRPLPFRVPTTLIVSPASPNCTVVPD